MSDAQVAFVEALIALGFSIGLLVRRPDPATWRTPTFAAIVALLAAGLVIRRFAVVPSLIHADMLGPGFVDAYLGFPAESGFRPTYGGFGFFAVGALTRMFGRDISAVFDAMQFVGFANVVLLAILARRLTGSMVAALFAVALSVTNPVLMRVAASEDMHNFALALALLGLILIDHYATTRKLAALVGAVVALALLTHTRQTFYLIPPCAFLLVLARGGLRTLKSPALWIGGLTVLAVLALRASATAGREGSALPKILGVVFHPVLVAPIFANHPLFDIARFGLLPLLTIAALVWATRAGRVEQALLFAFVLNFVATYTCGFPSPGVEFAQRLPVYALGVLLTAMFGARVVERCVDPAKRPAVAILAALVLFGAPIPMPGWRAIRALTTDYREYVAVESMLDELPSSFSLVTLPSPQNLLGYARYAGLFRRSGKRVRVVSPSELASASEPLVFLEGIECWTYTIRELTGVEDERELARMRGLRFDRSLFGRDPAPIRPVARMRDECARLLEGATSIGRPRSIPDPEDDPPFLYYARSPVPLRLHRLRRPG